MVESQSSSDDPSLLDRIRSWARTKAYASNYNPFAVDCHSLPAPVTVSRENRNDANTGANPKHNLTRGHSEGPKSANQQAADAVAEKTESSLSPPAPLPAIETGDGDSSSTIKPEERPNVAKRFFKHAKNALFYSWINVLLVFVPVGIVVGAMNKGSEKIDPGLVFAMNAIAIVPLAGLLSHATESVASKMGDTMGAFLNVTFGNAVELIIFIALVQDEVTLVQASLAGSILANLLLILGMCFLLGGLRYREQIYNSTVTQMSACLLSLSVMSLVLPTAFHASFTDTADANRVVLKVSRGTSVVLLLVYLLYLVFQLKSHAYMYEGTPQSVIDEESHPGVLADIFSSSSSGSSSDSSSSDSDSSLGSHATTKRIRRALRRKRHRKSSTSSSKDTHSVPSATRSPSIHTATNQNLSEADPSKATEATTPGVFSQYTGVFSGDEADTDGERESHAHHELDPSVTFRDFEMERRTSSIKSKDQESKISKRKSKKRARKSMRRNKKGVAKEENGESVEQAEVQNQAAIVSSPHVGFVEAAPAEAEAGSGSRRPFTLRSLSVRPALPPLPKVLTQTVFSSTHPVPAASADTPPAGGQTRTSRHGIRRTNSLPGRLNQNYVTYNTPRLGPPYIIPIAHSEEDDEDPKMADKQMSRTAAIMLLLISTGLVAVCAEFLVDSIDSLVAESHISEAFIGLIILPIVGNAAEHVTSVTVASKNKMDLAIGVAVGSSIQIAIFVTPLVVLLGWCMNVDMSLYFNLFQVVSLFASVFVVNFLVLDGRSNYLEGALLCAAYVIIAVAAFFYPSCANQSDVSGNC
ncbi:MAG: hypothetical protein M1834_008976 [Cirrosporium novae-zelandiae]|nr:MAG: hypothetical protein M1834_008976 [Cirrosporium novae-zelandiae]